MKAGIEFLRACMDTDARPSFAQAVAAQEFAGRHDLAAWAWDVCDRPTVMQAFAKMFADATRYHAVLWVERESLNHHATRRTTRAYARAADEIRLRVSWKPRLVDILAARAA